MVCSISYLEKFDKPAIQKYISTYSSRLKAVPDDKEALLAIGICYMRMSLHPLAERFLKQLIDSHPEDASGYYYRALNLLGGQRPKISNLKVIREIEQLILTSAQLDPANGRYEAILASIKYDYYGLNGMLVPAPAVEELVATAAAKAIDRLEFEQSFNFLRIPESPIVGKLFTGIGA